MRLTLAILACALCASAGDVTGKWTGTGEFTAPDGQIRNRDAVMDLKQNGAVVTGKAGPDEQEWLDIKDGKLEGNKLTFLVPIPNESRTFKGDMVLGADDTLSGTIVGETGDGEPLNVKVKFRRAAAAIDISGTWEGTTEFATPDGTDTGGAYAVVKQNGTEVTGTGGPSPDQQFPLINGKLEGNVLSFDLKGDGPSFKVKATIAGNKLDGVVDGEAPDGTKFAGKLTMTKK